MGIDICNSLVSWKQGKTATVAGKKTLKMAFKLLQEMKQAHATLNPHMKWGVQLILLSKILGESVKQAEENAANINPFPIAIPFVPIKQTLKEWNMKMSLEVMEPKPHYINEVKTEAQEGPCSKSPGKTVREWE